MADREPTPAVLAPTGAGESSTSQSEGLHRRLGQRQLTMMAIGVDADLRSDLLTTAPQWEQAPAGCGFAISHCLLLFSGSSQLTDCVSEPQHLVCSALTKP